MRLEFTPDIATPNRCKAGTRVGGESPRSQTGDIDQMTETMNRRDLVLASAALGVTMLAPLEYLAWARRAPDSLKPGEFVWEPEKSPNGLVAIVVSIPDQRVHVYRNGVRIGLSTCSTGKKGHSTPTGVFTILQKHKDHRSSTYNNAPMPNMNRLTWQGVALHAGNLPGYPASHGCIRLPHKFSEHLFGTTHVGTPVIVADDHSQPGFITHPGSILSALAEDEMDVALAQVAEKKLPPNERIKDTKHTVSVLVSSADRELTIIRDGEIVERGSIDIVNPKTPLGSHVFVLVGTHDEKNSLHWKSIGFSKGGASLVDSGATLIERVESSPALAKKIAELMHPGLILVMTDEPAHPETRTKRGFTVMAQDTSWETQTRSAN